MWSRRSLQRPARVIRSLAKSRCASARTKVSAMLATGRGTAFGVFATSTPARVIAATSTLS